MFTVHFEKITNESYGEVTRSTTLTEKMIFRRRKATVFTNSPRNTDRPHTSYVLQKRRRDDPDKRRTEKQYFDALRAKPTLSVIRRET